MERSGSKKRRAERSDENDKPKTLELKVRKLNPVNTLCYVQILGTGMDTQDTSPSVLLFFDKQRFIFNAGEGLQRFCTEHKIKLSKLDHMFLSRVCSETAGGLPGLLLTLAGIGEKGLCVNVWGPSDLNYLVDAMRSFIPKDAIVHTHSFGPAFDADETEQSKQGYITDPMVLVDDEVVKISAILLRPNYSEVDQLVDGNLPLSSSSSVGFEDDIISVLRLPISKNTNGDRLVLKPGDISVIYVCELPEIQGKFDPAKALALGLKPGPKYRELQHGNSVMSDRQNIMIHPSDVLGPPIPGPVVLLVDCPSVYHVQDLMSLPSLKCYYVDSGTDGKPVSCIIHLSPSSVTMIPDYRTWMERFGTTQHIMAGHEKESMDVPILRASARIAARLNYLCPHFFPSSGICSTQDQNSIEPELMASNEGSVVELSNQISAENLLKFHLRPYAQLGPDKSAVPGVLAPAQVVNELLSEIPEIADAAEHVRHLWDPSGHEKKAMASSSSSMVEEQWTNEDASEHDLNLGKQLETTTEEIPCLNSVNMDEINRELALPSCLENITREDMEIILLGTGSSQPSKYRNVSSIFINLFAKGSLLLDCGEGTLGQLKRRFGVKGADDAVRGLRCIWISHIHADHHTGLTRILSIRCKLLRGVPHEPLLVIGPTQLKRFLYAYQRLEDLDMQFLDCKHTQKDSLDAFMNIHESEKDYSLRSPKDNEIAYPERPQSPTESSAVLQTVLNLKRILCEAGLETLISVPVDHCNNSYGVVLKASERANTIGDTIPGWKLVYSGDTRPCPDLRDASRDATVLIHEATFEENMLDEAIKKHHSTTNEAVEIGYSAGVYRIILTHFSQRYPKIPVFDDTHMHRTCIAFDLMSINIADLPVLPVVLPFLKLLFRNEMMADETDDLVGPMILENEY